MKLSFVPWMPIDVVLAGESFMTVQKHTAHFNAVFLASTTKRKFYHKKELK